MPHASADDVPRMSRVTDPAVTGRRVLAALDAGRQRAIDRARSLAAPTEHRVRIELDKDILRDLPERGRASRIARTLRMKPGTVAKILIRLSSRRNSLAFNVANETGDRPDD